MSFSKKMDPFSSAKLQVDLEGGLLGRCFDAWEALGQSASGAEQRGFEVLLQVLPEATAAVYGGFLSHGGTTIAVWFIS